MGFPFPMPGRAPLFLAAAALLLACGCRRMGPPLAEPDFRARVAAAAAERDKLSNFAAEYNLTVEGARPGGKSGKLSCSGVLVAQGDRLRMRGEKVLGMAKIFDLLLDGREVRANLIHGNKCVRGRIDRVLERRGVAAYLDDRGGLDLAGLLLPTPRLDGADAPSELNFGRREVEAVWRSADGGRILRRTTFAADTGAVLATELRDPSGRVVAEISFDDPVAAGTLHPVGGFHARLEVPARLRLDVSFNDAEVNGAVKPAAFELKPLAGAEVVDFEKGEASAPAADGAGAGAAGRAP